MKAIRRAKRNLQYVPVKRQAKEKALKHTKDSFLKDRPELARELNVRDPVTISRSGLSAVETAKICTQICEEKRLEAEQEKLNEDMFYDASPKVFDRHKEVNELPDPYKPDYDEEKLNQMGQAQAEALRKMHELKIAMMKKYSMTKGMLSEPFDEEVIEVMRYFEQNREQPKQTYYQQLHDIPADVNSPECNPALKLVWFGDQKDKLRKIEYLDKINPTELDRQLDSYY